MYFLYIKLSFVFKGEYKKMWFWLGGSTVVQRKFCSCLVSIGFLSAVKKKTYFKELLICPLSVHVRVWRCDRLVTSSGRIPPLPNNCRFGSSRLFNLKRVSVGLKNGKFCSENVYLFQIFILLLHQPSTCNQVQLSFCLLMREKEETVI